MFWMRYGICLEGAKRINKTEIDACTNTEYALFPLPVEYSRILSRRESCHAAQTSKDFTIQRNKLFFVIAH